MVEVKFKKLPIRLLILCISTFSGILFIHALSIAKNNIYNIVIVFIFILCLITTVASIILYNIEKNYRIIFSDYGITLKLKIGIGPVLFHDEENLYSWEKVLTLFCFLGTFYLEHDEKRWYTHYRFGFTYDNLQIKLNCLKTNREEALKFILSKLPPTCEITKETRAKLRKKYGIIIETSKPNIPAAGRYVKS